MNALGCSSLVIPLYTLPCDQQSVVREAQSVWRIGSYCDSCWRDSGCHGEGDAVVLCRTLGSCIARGSVPVVVGHKELQTRGHAGGARYLDRYYEDVFGRDQFANVPMGHNPDFRWIVSSDRSWLHIVWARRTITKTSCILTIRVA